MHISREEMCYFKRVDMDRVSMENFLIAPRCIHIGPGQGKIRKNLPHRKCAAHKFSGDLSLFSKYQASLVHALSTIYSNGTDLLSDAQLVAGKSY